MHDPFEAVHVAATLDDGQCIRAEDVEQFLTEQSNPAKAMLPGAGCVQGRQLRRWALQVMLAELVAESAWAQPRVQAPPVDLPAPLRLRCEVGSICATVLSRSAAARQWLAATVLDPNQNSTRHQELLIRHQFEAQLRQAVQAKTQLSGGWHHPGDARHPESAHSH